MGAKHEITIVIMFVIGRNVRPIIQPLTSAFGLKYDLPVFSRSSESAEHYSDVRSRRLCSPGSLNYKRGVVAQ